MSANAAISQPKAECLLMLNGTIAESLLAARHVFLLARFVVALRCHQFFISFLH
jgi:hypothetical protein